MNKKTIIHDDSYLENSNHDLISKLDDYNYEVKPHLKKVTSRNNKVSLQDTIPPLSSQISI